MEICACGFVEYDTELEIWVLSEYSPADDVQEIGQVVWWSYCPECGTRLPGPRNADKLKPACLMDIWDELNYLRCRISDAELDNGLNDKAEVAQHLWAARHSLERTIRRLVPLARVLEIVENKTKEPRPRNAYWDARTAEDLEIIEELREEFTE